MGLICKTYFLLIYDIMSNILEGLNEEQHHAAACINGPVMVIAGAGSGKTRTLTYRIAHIIDQGVDAFNILSLTFTNKAAKEMKDRIEKLIGTEARNIWMGTFHSVFAKILRFEAVKIGYTNNFTIYDTDDAKALLKNIIKAQNLDPKVYPVSHVMFRISSAKNNLLSPAAYAANQEIMDEDKKGNKPFIAQLYAIYNQKLKLANAMDFDDLLYNTNVLFRDNPDILYKYQQKFKYILVDEYQDTNFSQNLIVKKLAAAHENLCVVGDDAQSIYAFRGANIENILNFKKDYPDAKVFKLEQNYRSTKMIVSAANSLIKKNKYQIAKEIWTDNEEGNYIPIIKASSENEEALKIAQSIFETKMNNQLRNDAFAILYRTNMQSRSLEEALRKLNIPYRIYGGMSFYKRKEIKDVLAYFRLVLNPYDEEAFMRTINFPARGIGQTTLDKLQIAADTWETSIWNIIERISEIQIDINRPTCQRLADFQTMIKSFAVQAKHSNAYDLAKNIVQGSGIIKALKAEDTPESENRIENIDELLNGIHDFCEAKDSIYDDLAEDEQVVKTLDMFLQEVSLLTDADENDEDAQNKVSLMTIHSAKGLEFPYVYIVGMEENLFPGMQSIASRADLEEERRLFYVALTRAEKQVSLSYAETRFRWGTQAFCEPSRFLSEIDEKYVESPNNRQYTKTTPAFGKTFAPKSTENKDNTILPANLSKFKKVDKVTSNSHEMAIDISQIHIGAKVFHLSFGEGEVLNLEGSGSDAKATILFKNAGQKNLLLKFAKLKIL